MFRRRVRAEDDQSPTDLCIGLSPRPGPEVPEVALPSVGSRFLNFRLFCKLGEGSFARVFLAKQGDLAGRPVVLKVTTDPMGEPDALAQLLHTNIVPIYSYHDFNGLSAICMPYLGTTTLEDVRMALRRQEGRPTSGQFIVDLIARESTTHSGVRDRLAELNYVDAVLWLGSRLADGLAHAHDRGILHRDLKPANVLLTNEGEPMLLDFNLAQDLKAGPLGRVGGTIPYMPPEQLASVLAALAPADAVTHLHGVGGSNVHGNVDGRTDLYALGLILVELLTGSNPFCNSDDPTEQEIPEIQARQTQGLPKLGRSNPQVSPAAESILRKCLQTDPERRYQSASEFKEDILLHLANRPLKHARNVSVRERISKWQKRNPGYFVGLIAAVLLAGVVVPMGQLLLGQGEALDRQESHNKYRSFVEDKRNAEVLLFSRTPGQEQIRQGDVLARELLGRYGVLDDVNWADSSWVQDLSPADQKRLRHQVGELLFLLARVAERLSVGNPSLLHDARRYNQMGSACYTDDERPWAIRAQSAALFGFRTTELPKFRTARDLYLHASDLAAVGRCPEATKFVTRAVRDDPELFAAWFLLGNCRLEMNQFELADGAFGTCIALQPTMERAWHHRGLARLHAKNHSAAADDFTRTIELNPEFSAAYIDRSLCRKAMGDLPGAIEDLTRALDLGDVPTRVYFLRSRVFAVLGDPEAAERDLEEGLRRQPTDPKSWIARGLARMNGSPTEALADFDAALQMDPTCQAALQNKAHVLAERLGQTEEGLEVLDRLLELYPNASEALGGRAVLNARLGRRDQAIADAEACLRADLGPAATYQTAGVYALTSRSHPADRDRALRLLSAALAQGYGHNLIDRDPDLDPIREDREFRRIVSAARILKAPRH